MKKDYQLSDFGVKRHTGTLKNGLRVTFIEKPFAPIYAKMMIRAGGIFDPLDRSGLAHFTEHIMMAGSERHSKDSFSAILDSVGGYWNARTNEEFMSVYCEVAETIHLQQMKEFFTEALSSIHVTDESVEKEKAIIRSEIERAHSEPSFQQFLKLGPIIGNGTHWRTPVIGTPESVSSITAQDVRTFFKDYCSVENMVLVIAGGCTWEDIEATFSEIPFLHGAVHELPPDPVMLAPQTIVFEEDAPQTRINLYFRGPIVNSREDYLITFALKLAHNGMTSRFYKKIRHERGLTYSLGYTVEAFLKLVYLGTSIGVPTDKVAETIDAILECYRELLEEGITQKEIDDKNATLWFSAKRSLETAEAWVSNAEYNALYPLEHPLHGPYPDVFNYRTTYTPEEIMAVLRKYITLDAYYLVISGRDVEKYKKNI